MGCYSFYRIIKDIIKTIFGRKVWKYTLIVLIAFTFFFILGEKGVFASWELSGEYNDGTEFTFSNLPDLPSGCDSFFIRKVNYSNFTHYIYAWNSFTDYIAISPTNGNVGSFIKDSSSNTGSIFYYSGYGTWGRWGSWASVNGGTISTANSVGLIYTNSYVYNLDNVASLKDSSENILFQSPNLVRYPEIITSIEDLQTLDFDVISINAGDFSDEDIDVLFYDLNYGTDTTDSLYPKTVITLNQNTTYFQPDLSSDSNAFYWESNKKH